jgi:hypothetical protein
MSDSDHQSELESRVAVPAQIFSHLLMFLQKYSTLSMYTFGVAVSGSHTKYEPASKNHPR